MTSLTYQDSQGKGTRPARELALDGAGSLPGERPQSSSGDLLQTPASGRRGRVVSVLREDPDLARHVDPAQAHTASRHAGANVVSLPKGMFCPHEWLPNRPGTFGMLVLDGLLLRGVQVAGRPSLEVLGTGDVVRPFEPERDPYAAVPELVRWWALRPAMLAVLDASFVRRMSDYPEVIGELAGRLASGSARGCLRLSIVQQPRLSTRLEVMLWHLADRFGRVHSEGVLVAVPMCQGLLSWLVGASRPAVCRAVKQLQREGRVEPGPDGTWWLRRRPEDLAELTLARKMSPSERGPS